MRHPFLRLVVACASVVSTGCADDRDWSVAMVESTMMRLSPSQIGTWSYTTGLYLYGQHLVYQRTGDPRFLAYIEAWGERVVDADGMTNTEFNSLDGMLPGRVLNLLHHDTGDARYEIAANKIRDKLDSYPRTTDGALWHSLGQDHQLWSDGAFMVAPFVAEYGREFDDADYANEESAKQLVVYASHLQQPGGLLRHAYDESRDQAWANPETGVSPEFWCRAVGWFGMATIDVLEVIPEDHPRRPALLQILGDMVAAFEEHQDPESGRWFQVVDKGDRAENWTETSCSSMYTFTVSRAVERGWVDASYEVVAERGYEGVLERISLDGDGLTVLSEVVVGTGVGDYQSYIDRPRMDNDKHGLGAFLIMNEQLGRMRGD